MWFIGVEVEQETSAPPSKKNPGSAPATKQERTQVYVAKKTHVYRVAGMIASIRGKNRTYIVS